MSTSSPSVTLAHVITRLSLGGSARNTMDSAAAAVRAGYRTLLITGPSVGEPDLTDEARRLGCEVLLVPSLRRSVSPFRDLAALWEVRSLLRREKAHIVHTHTSKAGFIGRIAARLAGVPVVIHTPHGHILYGYYGPAGTRLFAFLERVSAPLCDRIVTLTDRGAREHLAQGIGNTAQYVTIPSGVDVDALRERALDKAQARHELGWELDAAIVLGVGRLVPIKGFDLLIRALAHLKPAPGLVLVGDGPERERLQSLAAELGVAPRVTFAGAIEDVTPFLCAADVMVVPSRNEGMGRALVEAMALGVPVVGASVGGIPSVIEDGRSGLLVSREDVAGIADAVQRLLARDDLAASLADGARSRAEAFSLPVMERALLELYRVLALDKGLNPPGPADTRDRAEEAKPVVLEKAGRVL